MKREQVVVTTVFGSGAELLPVTFATFLKDPNLELHAFVYSTDLPEHRHPQISYHLVDFDPAFISVRRDALFRRWIWPDTLDAEFAMVADGTDVICIRPLPRFADLLRGAHFAAAPEWCGPVKILGQGFTGCFLNAGITIWHLPSSKNIREEIVECGRRHYRGPFDDQTVLNEVIQTKFFNQMTILPSQFNWRAFYKHNTRCWQNHWRIGPRVDCLDGVYLYHNQHCNHKVLADLYHSSPPAIARLEKIPQDVRPLSSWDLFWRRLKHRLNHT